MKNSFSFQGHVACDRDLSAKSGINYNCIVLVDRWQTILAFSSSMPLTPRGQFVMKSDKWLNNIISKIVQVFNLCLYKFITKNQLDYEHEFL